MLPGSAWNRSLQLSVSCCQISSTNTGRVFFFRSRAGGLAVKQSSSHHKTQEAFEITAPTVRRRRFASHFCKTEKKSTEYYYNVWIEVVVWIQTSERDKMMKDETHNDGDVLLTKKMEWKCRGKKRSVLGEQQTVSVMISPLIVLPVTCPQHVQPFTPIPRSNFISLPDCCSLFCQTWTSCNTDLFYLGLLALIQLQQPLEKAIIINTD